MPLANGDVPVVRTRLPEMPEAAVDMTVAKMMEIALGVYGSRSPRIRALAINIVRQAKVPEKDYYGEILAIHDWIKRNIRYMHDPVNQETLSHPEELAFNTKAGDCLAGDTHLLTPNGRIRIADVRPGDTIWGKHGWTKVMQWWDKGVLPVKTYRLGPYFFICTDEHRCFLANGAEILARDLRVGTRLLSPCVPHVPAPKREITKIEDAGVAHVYDIETEDHGIYLPDADVIVHNCDDMTVLEIALLSAIGVKAWPVVIGLQPGTFSHVYLRALVPPGKHRMAGKAIALDPIMKNWQAGREAPANKVKNRKEYPTLTEEGTMPTNGMMRGVDLGDIYGGIQGLGSYVKGPSYLDTEHSHAEMLLSENKALVSRDKTLATTPRVTQNMNGLDGMLSAYDEVVIDDPTQMNSDQLDQLGPKGPLIQRTAALSTTKLAHKTYEVVGTTAALAKARGKAAAETVDPRATHAVVRDVFSQVADARRSPPPEKTRMQRIMDRLTGKDKITFTMVHPTSTRQPGQVDFVDTRSPMERQFDNDSDRQTFGVNSVKGLGMFSSNNGMLLGLAAAGVATYFLLRKRK
jgi:hypothetical protein